MITSMGGGTGFPTPRPDVVCYDLDLLCLFVADKVVKNGANRGCRTADFIVRYMNLQILVQ